jgi:hypothetical protein
MTLRRPDVPVYVQPVGPRTRALIIIFLFALVHLIGMTIAFYVVQNTIELFDKWSLADTFFCGDGATAGFDFSRHENGIRRGLDDWIVCFDANGAVIQGAGRWAAWKSGLPISVPLIIPMVMHLLRKWRSHPPGRPVLVELSPRPVTSRMRSVIFSFAMIGALFLARSVADFLLVVGWDYFESSAIAGSLLCGTDAAQLVTLPDRRIACLNVAGAEVGLKNRPALMLSLAIWALALVPIWMLTIRFRTIRRRFIRYDPERDDEATPSGS